MINLLILFELNKRILTMYGILNQIKKEFSVLLSPSIGTIKPALKRLELSGFISSQKYISSGGRQATHYSITEQGKVALNGELLAPLPENPIQFLVNARIRLCCANVLTTEDFHKMLSLLKKKTEAHLIESQKLIENDSIDFYPKMVFDNLTCEYANFFSLLEGIEHACKH